MLGKLAIVSSFCAVAAGTALAGAHWTTGDPSINVTSRYAAGALGDARQGTDPSSYIGCEVIGYSGGASAFCYAGRSTASAYCWTTDPSLIAAAAAVDGGSEVYFTWDAGGRCTYISTVNTSGYAPKQP